jgi:hypothetical protein
MYFLGYQRFADVQVMVMGAPVTSGIDTFDFFISGELLEVSMSLTHCVARVIASLSNAHRTLRPSILTGRSYMMNTTLSKL